MPKQLNEGPFSLARYCMLRGKTGKPFWFSSLGQIVQFGAIIFCRTFKNYFGMVCYAEKQEKPFWFSSLGQIVQFGAIIFCRTFKNYFGQCVWIEQSHYNSRVSLHEAPTKNCTLRESNLGDRDRTLASVPSRSIFLGKFTG